jgi:cytochrome P450 family 135
MMGDAVAPGALCDEDRDAMDRDQDTALALPPGPRANHRRQALSWLRDPIGFMERGRERYGPVFSARFGARQRAVFLSSPETVERVVAGDAELMRMGDANGLFRPVVGPSSILLLDGEEHLRHRRLMLPAFRRSHAELFEESIAVAAERRLESWPVGRPFALLPEMEEIAFVTIMRMVFGLERSDREPRLRELFGRMMDFCERPVNLLPWFRFEAGGLSPWGRLMRVVDELDELLRSEIRDRRTDPAVDHRDDLLSLLCRATQADGTPMTESELRDELVTMLMAGQETTSASLAWAFERLTRHPRVLERLQAELREGEETYLDAVIKETLRQRPAIPVMVRKLRTTMRFGGYDVPAGWVVMPSIYLLHREPSVYPRPHEFEPERFLHDPPPAHAWIPFGGGSRRCLGANLAQVEMRVVLRTVLSRVRFAPSARASEPAQRRRFAISPRHDAIAVVAERLPGRAAPSPASTRLREHDRTQLRGRTPVSQETTVEPMSKPPTSPR